MPLSFTILNNSPIIHKLREFAQARSKCYNINYNAPGSEEYILCGAIAEYVVSQYIIFQLGLHCTEPDLNIYSTEERIQMGHGADLHSDELGDIHVKSCRNPKSLNDSSWAYKSIVEYTEKQQEDMHAYTNISQNKYNEWCVDIIGFYKTKDIVPLWKPPRLKKYAQTKKIIYHKDLVGLPTYHQ